MPDYDLIAILGPTASGKPLCCRISCRLRYWNHQCRFTPDLPGMDLGTGKIWKITPSTGSKFPITWSILPTRVINTMFLSINVISWQLTRLLNKRAPSVLCGGTGLYLESVLKGYRLIPVPENQELRTRLAEKSLEELTGILSQYKTLHNSTDVDTVKRAIRAIEIEEYYAKTPIEEREFPQLNSLIIGVDIDRELRREKSPAGWSKGWMTAW